MINNHLVLVSGKSASGKSASLRALDNPEGVIYLNCENGKKLPFKMKDVHTIVIDSLTYLMDMFESTKVLTATDSRSAWQEYGQYMRRLMSQVVAKSTKNVIFLAHTTDVLNESEMINETIVKVKGALNNVGIESFFSTVISTKKLSLEKLNDKNAKSKFYTVMPEEKELGFKYVFQTRITKDTIHERIRAPMDMWKSTETYIDNNLQHVINRLHDYYK